MGVLNPVIGLSRRPTPNKAVGVGSSIGSVPGASWFYIKSLLAGECQYLSMVTVSYKNDFSPGMVVGGL